MSRATPDDQLKFLLNCVKHSNNGKIDFVEVAKECGIVSKGAAAKRYERLMKANGIHPNGGPSDKPITPTAPRVKSKTAMTTAAASKRRKIEGLSLNFKADDNDDGMLTKSKTEQTESQNFKPEPTLNETKKAVSSGLPPSVMISTSLQTPVQFSPPMRPQQLFNSPHLAYPHPRQYHPHMAHVAHYPGSLMPLPPSSPSPMTQYQYALQQSTIVPRHVPNLDDRSIFEDFCTPELFEQRTFREMPHVEEPAPVPPPPQEVTVQHLCIEDMVEKKSEESRSGKRLSESILILD